jgi:choline kinase
MINSLIVLAAGIGSRLRPLTNDTPKCLVKINSKTILGSLIDNVPKGVKIYLATGYLSKEVEKFCSQFYFDRDISIIENKDYESTNNMFSLDLVLKSNPKILNGNVVISNGDCVYDKQILEMAFQEPQSSVIFCDVTIDKKDAMKIKVEGDVTLKGIDKQYSELYKNINTIDLYSFNRQDINSYRKIIEEIVNQHRNKWNEVAIDFAIKTKSIPFRLQDINGLRWYEIDNTEDLETARRLFNDF